jgi:hypothetical protein
MQLLILPWLLLLLLMLVFQACVRLLLLTGVWLYEVGSTAAPHVQTKGQR